MKSFLKTSAKSINVALIAIVLMVAMSISVILEPTNAAESCRKLAITLGGCEPTDKICIREYCAGRAFEDIMGEIGDQNRQDRFNENKALTEEVIGEDPLCENGTNPDCDAGNAPVITLLGAPSVFVFIGDTYGAAEDAGATALDDIDGDITGNIVVGGLPVDTSSSAIFTVTYNVSDSDGNPAVEVTRTVTVNLPPG